MHRSPRRISIAQSFPPKTQNDIVPNAAADAVMPNPKGRDRKCTLRSFYSRKEITPTNVASSTRLELTSNRNALEAGTGGTDDPTALFSKALAFAVVVGEACAMVIIVVKPCWL